MGLSLRCPTCGAPLPALPHPPEQRGSAPELVCDPCGERFPVEHGVPRLISRDNPLFDRPAATDQGTSGRQHRASLLRRLSTLLPDPDHRTGPDLITLAARHVEQRPARVLIIGLGDGTWMIPPLKEAFGEVTATDVVSTAGADYVCDAHALPFADDSFDVVTLIAVLEHVLDPTAVVAEVERVLKKGGVVIAETPFIQQVHMGAWDFTRFTELGHRWLFKSFHELARGSSAGPATALAWSLIYALVGLTGSPRAAAIAKGIGRLAFARVASLDVVLGRARGSSDGAALVYFVGKNEKRPVITPRELVQSYRGAVR